MASAVYPSALKLFLDGDIDMLNDDIRAILIDTADYSYSSAHDYLDDVAAGARVKVSDALASKTTTGGVFDAADKTLSAVTGDQSEAVIIYKHTGTESTSPLIAYIDSGTGLPVTPNGGDITLTWNASGIFSI